MSNLARELRIGNIVECDFRQIPTRAVKTINVNGKYYCFITAHGIDMIDRGYIEAWPASINSVWLAEFGFKEIEGTWGIAGIHLRPTKSNNFNILTFPIKEIQHVHHLQNVIFDFCGHELTIE